MKSKHLFILLCTLINTWGCASKPRFIASTQPSDRAMLTIDQIEPAVSIPTPTTQLTTLSPPVALELYAAARHELLDNHKQLAIDKLNAAIELDPNSSVLYRDLGYAWFATDNTRSLSAFKKAAEIDPSDVEIHAQIGRLYAIQGKFDDAIRELRIARLTPDYQTNPLDAAIVDLLLGRVLNERGYYTASVDSLERLLPVIEHKTMDMRRWMELYELATSPSKVRLTIADLSSRIGRYDRALELYERVSRDEPSLAIALDLRIIQTRMHKGETDHATLKMLNLINRFDGNRTSIQSYLDLFTEKGGDLAALQSFQKNVPDSMKNQTSMRVLETRLLRRLTRFDQALEVINQPDLKATFPAVRELVMAFRDAGKTTELLPRLMQIMIDQPGNWSSIWRGWEILTQDNQPNPVTAADLLNLKVPVELEAARLLVAARIAVAEHQKIVSRDLLNKALSINQDLVKKWTADQVMQFIPDVDATSPVDLGRYIDEFSNDPQYLQMSVEHLVKLSGPASVTTSLQAAVGRNPKNVVALTQLIGLLIASERKTEAIKAVEDSSAAVSSAPEIYQLAMLASSLEQKDLCERLLRRAVAINPNHGPSANDLGYQLIDAGKEIDFAEGLLWKAVGQEPGNGAYLDSLAWMLYKRGDFNQAALYLDKAITNSDPVDPVLFDHAGDSYHRLKTDDKAKLMWQNAIEQIKRAPEASDPQLRLLVEQKLRQLDAGETVTVAPTLEEQSHIQK